MIDSFHDRAHVKTLFDRVRRIRNDEENSLPFEFWLDFALEFGLDLPNRFKTYRGLVVSSDKEELDLIKEYNQEAVNNWTSEPSLVPSFFLATLDLSGDRTFTDSDIYKLRNPLSSLLAVLKLDNTSITDGGIAWIARAASDPQAYKHLEVLSLRGLSRVTNVGVARLRNLYNLRMIGQFLFFVSPQRGFEGLKLCSPRRLDLRNTGCDQNIAAELNKLDVSPSWSPPRARRDLKQTLVEFQLFGGSLSSSRTLSVLHHLAQVHHAPIQSLEAVKRLPLNKQLSIHLEAMTRRPAQASSKATEEKTPEELYKDQLALSNFAGSALATHHTAFGTLTSTKSLARKLIQDDGRAMGEKGSAFKKGDGDSVALGEWVGQGRVGGRASLYDLGTKKVSISRRPKEREPFSDTEDEEEKESSLREEEAEALRIWEEQVSTGYTFYAGRKPVPKLERVIVAAKPSKLTLIRHLPFVPPHERQATTSTDREVMEEEETTPVKFAIQPEVQVREGSTLLKKKRKVDQRMSTVSRPPISTSSSPAPASPAHPLLTPSSSSSSRRGSRPSAGSTLPKVQSTPISSNPFSKTPAKAGAGRTDRKNIVKCGSTLAKRSSLSAFKR
jgi:hypothetical protein